MSEEQKVPSNDQRRRKRVQFFKKAIIALIIIAVILPPILCTILFVKMHRLEEQIQLLTEAREQNERIAVTEDEDNVILAGRDEMAVESAVYEEDDAVFSSDEEQSSVTNNYKKKVYLTFDDGPSPYTGTILDICQKYNVKVSFFVVGKAGSKYEELYRRIAQEGHTLGMHSYSHKYSEIYADLESYEADLERLRQYIYNITGVMPNVCRFPGGSSNKVSKVPIEDCIQYLNEQGITYYDWNVSSNDANGKNYSARQIADNVLDHIDEHKTSIVLMHDAADKTQTVEALPIILEALLAREDVEILPITDETEKIQHVVLEKQ